MKWRNDAANRSLREWREGFLATCEIRLDFSVHLSVNRKRRNTKQRIESKEYERRTRMTTQTTTNTQEKHPTVRSAVPATALDGQVDC